MDKEGTRIIIAGAKPNSRLVSGNAIYCANTAIGIYQDYLKNFKYVVSLLNAKALTKEDIGSKNKEIITKKRSLILSNAFADKYIVIGSTSSHNVVKKQIEQHNESAAIIVFSKQRKRELVHSVTKLKEPYITLSFFTLPFKSQLYGIQKLVKRYLRESITKDKKEDFSFPSYFRISTGLFALIYAIAENGINYEYVICGIGVGDRDTYDFGKNNKYRKLPDHIHADLKALKRLKTEYRIVTTEEELAKITNLPLINK
jgi:hypothetical protein